jgi:hypothetical protein
MEEWRNSSTILDLGTIWRAVSFTPLHLYPWLNSPIYPLERRLGVPQSRSGRCAKKRDFSLLPEI